MLAATLNFNALDASQFLLEEMNDSAFFMSLPIELRKSLLDTVRSTLRRWRQMFRPNCQATQDEKNRLQLLGGVCRSQLVGGIDRSQLLRSIDRSQLLGGIDRPQLLGGIDRAILQLRCSAIQFFGSMEIL